MRKNAPRKWLHACLDLLPVLLIPVFMVYSHRHTIDSGSITRAEPSTYNLQQLVLNGKPNGLNNWNSINVAFINNSFELDNGEGALLTQDFNYSYSGITKFYSSFYVECSLGESEPYLEFALYTDIGNSGLFETIEDITNTYNKYSFILTTLNEDDILNQISFESTGNDLMYIKDIQLFNLTAIFGSGNEPTKEEFECLLTQDYYVYGVDYVVSYGTHDVTYDDTDIMSQFTYQLYNATDKYFNMDRAFNLGNVHQWFNDNIFCGNPPIVINIIWHIVAYELLMDLLFLLYALFMWFVDWCKSLIERTYDKSSGRR